MGSQPSTQATPRRGIAREGRSLSTLRRVSKALRHRAERPPGGGTALRVPAPRAPSWGGLAFPACAHWPAIAGFPPAAASFPHTHSSGGPDPGFSDPFPPPSLTLQKRGPGVLLS